VLLSLNKSLPGEYLFAIKVADEPGPIFNITLPSAGARHHHSSAQPASRAICQ
jgi:hypothetical protein